MNEALPFLVLWGFQIWYCSIFRFSQTVLFQVALSPSLFPSSHRCVALRNDACGWL